MSSDLFCAFQPKRVIVPSFALRLAVAARLTLPPWIELAWPLTPNCRFAPAFACWLARMAESGIASIRPAPRVGVGMRKTTLLLPPCPVTGLPAGVNTGWVMLQLVLTSLRPLTTNRLCTPPSGTPPDCLKRASRTGPFCASNHGISLLAPAAFTTEYSGFAAGLEPPMYGWAWHEKHEFELKRGPSPLPWEAPCVVVAPETTDR